MIYGTQEFADLLKDLIRNGKRHDLYDQTVRHAQEMSVHIDGDKPYFLLERNRPREEDEVKAYRLENYEPITKADADRAITVLAKGFNPNLYSIYWKEKTKEGEELEQYTLEYYPKCNSLINFNKDVLLRKMLADPNGLVAIKPENIPDDDTEKLKPITVVYGSSCVWYYDKDHYLIAIEGESFDKGENERDNQQKSVRFEYYDKTQYIDFTATYDASSKTIIIDENTPPYKHGGGKIPVWFLGGKSKNLDNGKILYQSFFSAALPHWNLSVKHSSDLMASIIGHIYPQKYEVAEECAYSFLHAGFSYSCRGGKISYPGGPNGSVIHQECPQCSGAGLVSVRGPLNTYLWNKEKLQEGPGLSILPAGYLDVPIDATKFLDEYTEKMNQKAMAAIHMDIEDKVGENQSGVAKTIDRSGQNALMLDVHSWVWGMHTNNQYYFINMYRNGPSAKSTGKEGDQKFLPEINGPTKFDLLSTSDMIFNFKVSKDSGLDRNILRTQAIEIIKSENGYTPDMRNYQMSLIELDPLYAFTTDEIDLGVSKGVIRKISWALHDNIKYFIDKAIQADKKFLSKDRQDQIVVLEGFASELITAEKPRIDEDAMMLSFDKESQKDAA